jgi:uroporphyrinogen-III synthase
MKRLRLLITRKMDASLRKTAEEHGVEVIEKEFIHIQLLRVEAAETLALENIAAIFTSKNAVKAVAGSVAASNEIKWKIFCLAGATQTIVKKYFPSSTIITTGWNAVELAEKIISMHVQEALVFFCGDKRRNDLPDALKNGSLPLKEIVSYKTLLTPVKVEEKFDAVAFFSPTAVESFFSLNTVPDDMLCFSIGNTTSSALEKYTVRKIITLPEASEKSLVEEAIKIINEN